MFWREGDHILGTYPRMGTSSLLRYGQRLQLKGLDETQTIRQQNKGTPIWMPMRDPIERAHSAYRHKGVRARYQGNDFYQWWERAKTASDMHVLPISTLLRREGLDPAKITWIPWSKWVKMFDMPGKGAKIHENRSDRADLSPIEPTEAMLDYYKRDLGVFEALGEANEPETTT
jgi:hypothetical protein